MKPEIKKLWVEALRNGKYKQGTEYLKNDMNEYCCLGVLCDISKLGSWEPGNIYLNCSEFLPNEVMKWAGLEDVDPMLGDRCCSLYNDGGITCDRITFNEIADLIEKYL